MPILVYALFSTYSEGSRLCQYSCPLTAHIQRTASSKGKCKAKSLESQLRIKRLIDIQGIEKNSDYGMLASLELCDGNESTGAWNTEGCQSTEA